jgi:hypothetical protein
MADLYAILAKAVAGLDSNTKEARRRLYERARAALVAETHGLAKSETEFLAVLGSLENAIQRLEAEALAKAQRERRSEPPRAATSAPQPRSQGFIQRQADATSSAPPRRNIAAGAPHPATPVARQRFPQVMPFFARALRLGRDGARNLLQRPARQNESLPGDLLDEMDFAPPPDNWLSDLLARASRPEHDNADRSPLPRRDGRRNR